MEEPLWFEIDGRRVDIDGDDLLVLVGREWYVNSKGYVTARGECAVKLHALIVGTPKGMDTHHRDENKLNNKRSNLEVLTPQEHGKRHTGRRYSGRDHRSRVSTQLAQQAQQPRGRISLLAPEKYRTH